MIRSAALRMRLAVAVTALALVGGCANGLTARSASGPATTPALIQAGDARRSSGDLPGAAALYRSAADTDSKNADALIRLGEVLNEAGAPSDAAEAFRDALRIDSKNSEAQRGMGNALVGLGQGPLAIPYFETAATLAPQDWRPYLGLGVAQDLSGNPDKAREAYTAGLTLAPNNPDLLNNYGLSLALAEDDQAVAILRRLSAGSADRRYSSTLAIALALTGNEAEAADLLRKTETPDTVDRMLETLRAIRAIPDHGRKAMALRTDYFGSR